MNEMDTSIETKRLLIRKVTLADEWDLFEILSDDQTCLDGGGKYAHWKLDQQFREWLIGIQTQRRYAVVLKCENKCIGLISLKEESRAVPSYTIGFTMNNRYRRKGYCLEAVDAVMKSYFQNTDTQMFTASHFPHNTASQKLIEQLGFTLEGRMRNAMEHAEYGPIDLMCYYKEK